jgi:hypothetical protein
MTNCLENGKAPRKEITLFKAKIEERKKAKIREIDILEIPKGPLDSTFFRSAIL